MDARDNGASGQFEDLNTNESLSRFRFFSRKRHNAYFAVLLQRLVDENPRYWDELKKGEIENVEWEESDAEEIDMNGMKSYAKPGESSVYDVERATMDDTGKRLRIMFVEGDKTRNEWAERIPAFVRKPKKTKPASERGLQPLFNFLFDAFDEE